MTRFFRIYDSIFEVALVAIFCAMIMLMFSEVIARHVFNNPIIWSEELGRMLFIWSVFLGASLGFLRKSHITIDYFSQYIPPILVLPVSLLINALVLATLIFVFLTGTQFAVRNFGVPAYSIPFVNLGWAYAAVPLGALTMMLNLLRTIFEDRKTPR